MIQFQFLNSLGFNCFELLKQKLRGSSDEYLVTKTIDQAIVKWQLVRNLKTGKFQDLYYMNTFHHSKKVIVDAYSSDDENTTCTSGYPIEVEIDCTIPFENSIQQVLGYAFDSKTNEIITAGNDTLTRINCTQELETLKHAIHFAFYECINKKFLIIGFEEGKIEIWDWETKQFFKTLRNCNNCKNVFSLTVNEKSKELLVSTDCDLELWCLKTCTLLKNYYSGWHSTCPTCFLDCYSLVVGGGWGFIKVWNNESTACVFELKNPHDDNVNNLLYMTELNLVISSGEDKFVKVWEPIVFHDDGDNNKKMELKLKFQIGNPFGENHILEIQLLNETQVLVTDVKDNLFVLDLVLKKVIWIRAESNKTVY